MKKIVLAAVLSVVPIAAFAGVKQIEQTGGMNGGRRTITSYYDTASEQYCLVFVSYDGVAMSCTSVEQLSEQAQENILRDSYAPTDSDN